MPNNKKKITQTRTRFIIYGMDKISAFIETLKPSFLEISPKEV